MIDRIVEVQMNRHLAVTLKGVSDSASGHLATVRGSPRKTICRLDSTAWAASSGRALPRIWGFLRHGSHQSNVLPRGTWTLFCGAVYSRPRMDAGRAEAVRGIWV